MSPDQRDFLSLRYLPARLTVEQTAQLLGFYPHDIPLLTAKGFLHPLGKPRANSTKWFAVKEVQRLADDEKRLSRACEALQNHWRDKNSRHAPPAAADEQAHAE